MSVAIVERHNRDFDLDGILQRSPEAQDPEASFTLKRCLKMSEEVWFGLYNDEVACAWGLIPPTIISNRAHLWLVTTELVEQHKFTFIRRSQIVIKDALDRYDSLIGDVKVGNTAARKWLQWLGADIGPPEKGYSPFRIRRR